MLLSSGMNLSSPNCMPTTVIAGQDRQPVCESQQSSSTIIPQQRSINPRQGRRNKSFVDPCEIAPLKKRRIQVCIYIMIVLIVCSFVYNYLNILLLSTIFEFFSFISIVAAIEPR